VKVTTGNQNFPGRARTRSLSPIKPRYILSRTSWPWPWPDSLDSSCTSEDPRWSCSDGEGRLLCSSHSSCNLRRTSCFQNFPGRGRTRSLSPVSRRRSNRGIEPDTSRPWPDSLASSSSTSQDPRWSWSCSVGEDSFLIYSSPSSLQSAPHKLCRKPPHPPSLSSRSSSFSSSWFVKG
jgi:hypothetical protein